MTRFSQQGSYPLPKSICRTTHGTKTKARQTFDRYKRFHIAQNAGMASFVLHIRLEIHLLLHRTGPFQLLSSSRQVKRILFCDMSVFEHRPPETHKH